MKQLYLMTFVFLWYHNTGTAQKSYPIYFVDTLCNAAHPKSGAMWENATEVTDFTTSLPRFGQSPNHPTSVRMLYAKEGIALRVFCYTHLVRDDGSLRDEAGTGDFFSVGFDTWNDGQNAFLFTVTAAGQMMEARVNGKQTEPRFDTPWKSSVRITAEGWEADIWIPFTALRFAPNGPQHWGLQFTRFDKSAGELSTWSPQDPLVNDLVLQYGQLEGMGEIRQKKRLGVSVLGSDNSLGIDGKIGINAATTLDFNIVPDILFTGNLDWYHKVYPQFRKVDFLLQYTPTFDANRQSNMEDPGIYNRSPAFLNNKPVQLWQTDYLENITGNQKNPLVVNPIGMRTLSRIRLNSNFKKGWTAGIEHHILLRPEYLIFDSYILPDELDSKPKTYAPIPFYTAALIEKRWRKNSWVQLSNGYLHLGGKLNTNATGVAMQLRDRQNKYEISGNALTLSSITDSLGKKFNTGGAIQIARVNSRLTGYIRYDRNHNSPTPYTRDIVFSDKKGSAFSAQISLQNFHPKWDALLQTTHSFEIQKNFNNAFSLFTTYRYYALSKRFRYSKLSFSPYLYPKSLEFTFPDIVLKSDGWKTIPLALGTEFSSDTRKKMVGFAGIQFAWLPQYRQVIPGVGAGGTWQIIGPLQVGLNSNFALPSQAFVILTANPSGHYARKTISLDSDHRFWVLFCPNKHFTLQQSGTIRFHNGKNKSAFLIDNSGQLQQVPWTFNPVSSKSRQAYLSTTLQYTLHTMGYLQSHIYTFAERKAGARGGKRPEISYSISWVYNFYTNTK